MSVLSPFRDSVLRSNAIVKLAANNGVNGMSVGADYVLIGWMALQVCDRQSCRRRDSLQRDLPRLDKDGDDEEYLDSQSEAADAEKLIARQHPGTIWKWGNPSVTCIGALPVRAVLFLAMRLRNDPSSGGVGQRWVISHSG